MAASFGVLPELLQEIAEVAGLDAAMAIAAAKGGIRAHFPARADDEHWLTRAVGREAADKLCTHFCVNHRGGVTLQVPLGPRNFYSLARRRAVEMAAEGHSIAGTARSLGVTTRAVEKWRAKNKADPRQGRLF